MRTGFQPVALPTELNPVDCSDGVEPTPSGATAQRSTFKLTTEWRW